MVSHLFLYLTRKRMRIEGNAETEKSGDKQFGRHSFSPGHDLHSDIPVSFNFLDQMFYHRFRTSNELCSAGLFTPDPHVSNKKHRKMKCK